MRGVALLCLLLGALALCAGQITTFLDNNVYSVSECVPKTSAVCNGYANLAIGTLVLIPSNSTEQDQEDFANRRLAAAQILSTVGYPSCQKYIELYWCLRAFVPCEIYQVNATTSVALPMYMCPGVCLNGSAICEEPYRIGGYDLPSCPDVPSYDFSASAGPNNVTANCTNVAASSSPGNLCTVLHEVYYSQSEADRIYDFYRVMGWICLALNVLVLVLHLANPKLRTWPVHLIVAMCISQILLCLGLLFSTFAKREKLFCEEGALRNLCHAQGGFIFGGLLFAIATWLTLTVTNLVVIVRNDPRRMLRWFQTKWYFVMGYLVVPLVPACLFWANIGTDNSSNSSLLYCSSNKLSPFQNYFVIPVIIFVFLGTLCIIATAVILIKDLKHGLRDFALYARLLIYELVALFPATVLVIPFEYNYPKLKRNDESIYRDGSFKRAVSCITIGSAITPLLFALIFLLKWEHWDFFKEKVGSFTTFTTSGGTSASGSRGGASTSRSDREGDNPEISKF